MIGIIARALMAPVLFMVSLAIVSLILMVFFTVIPFALLLWILTGNDRFISMQGGPKRMRPIRVSR